MCNDTNANLRIKRRDAYQHTELPCAGIFSSERRGNMQFTINQAELMSALNAGKASCKKRSSLEAINNVLIQAGSGEVCFTTTDLTMRITYRATDTVQIVEGPIDFASLCEHHVLPFIGQAYIGCLRHE